MDWSTEGGTYVGDESEVVAYSVRTPIARRFQGRPLGECLLRLARQRRRQPGHVVPLVPRRREPGLAHGRDQSAREGL